ncbi:hypothetical protein [Thiocystis violascens]|uniref:Uncharacterized protein n=1 Tax=Thiocystis violascens (strain ATCC 17096 / DSM 198 / 6111) TaxID=765911 RepID=I3Y5I0_THIV6|nr:hypothetical protein [Thiocystis violascens]AFL72248.1 hypothetical protein Thivi_0175 [Thiocystis violascens DSM 198]
MLKKLLLVVALIIVVGGGYLLYEGRILERNSTLSDQVSGLAYRTGLDGALGSLRELMAKASAFISNRGFERQSERTYRERWCQRGDRTACTELCDQFGDLFACERFKRRE